MKSYADNKAYVKPSDFKVGDSVLVKNTGISKAQTPCGSIPLEIIAKKGSMVTAQRGEQDHKKFILQTFYWKSSRRE